MEIAVACMRACRDYVTHGGGVGGAFPAGRTPAGAGVEVRYKSRQLFWFLAPAGGLGSICNSGFN
jgi:hypothetical protein